MPARESYRDWSQDTCGVSYALLQADAKQKPSEAMWETVEQSTTQLSWNRRSNGLSAQVDLGAGNFSGLTYRD